MSVTKRQAAVLELYRSNDKARMAEGIILDALWPQVRNVRLVMNGLEARSLVTQVRWVDEQHGAEYEITAAGLESA